ncbi:MAG: hypothetical protein B5M55_05055 [Desulfococcus sp. 4484_242]|nr:MAG: hypothetical protein B5M55_05055 [Desulfococcus sp. 4484_242]
MSSIQRNDAVMGVELGVALTEATWEFTRHYLYGNHTNLLFRRFEKDDYSDVNPYQGGWL